MHKHNLLLLFLILCLTAGDVSGQAIVITGKALDAKAGGVIITQDSGMYYIEGVVSWDKKYYDKMLEVHGNLKVTKIEKAADNNSLVAQQIVGYYRLVRSPKWKLIK